MNGDGMKYVYDVVLSGNAVEAVIAPLDASLAAHWASQTGASLFKETFETSEYDDVADSSTRLPNWRDCAEGLYLEGVQLHHGRLEVKNSDGQVIYSLQLESDEFHSRHVDDVIEYSEQNRFGVEGAAFVAFTGYEGELSGKLELSSCFDPDILLAVISRLEDTSPFVNRLIYEGREIELVGSGQYQVEFASIRNLDGGAIVHWNTVPSPR